MISPSFRNRSKRARGNECLRGGGGQKPYASVHSSHQGSLSSGGRAGAKILSRRCASPPLKWSVHTVVGGGFQLVPTFPTPIDP